MASTILEANSVAAYQRTCNPSGRMPHLCWEAGCGTDGSKLDQGNAVAAVCWRDKRLDQWKVKGFFLEKNKEILDAELWAIVEALSIAKKEILNARDTPIKFFCDSQKALKPIEHPIFIKETGFWEALSTKRPENSRIADTPSPSN